MAQLAELLLDTFGAPEWALKSILGLFIVGFPFAVFFAWAFELTPAGIKREDEVDRGKSITPQTGRKPDRAIIALLSLALVWFVRERYQPRDTAQHSVSSGADVDSAPPPASEGSDDGVRRGGPITYDRSARSLKPGLLEAELARVDYLYRVEHEYGQAVEALEALGEEPCSSSLADTVSPKSMCGLSLTTSPTIPDLRICGNNLGTHR